MPTLGTTMAIWITLWMTISIGYPIYYIYHNEDKVQAPAAGNTIKIPPTLSFSKLVIQGTSLTYDGEPINSTKIYFWKKKSPAEKDLYTIWQPLPRGILMKANSSEVFKVLNASNIRIFSYADGAGSK